jgi:hypothetical protein
MGCRAATALHGVMPQVARVWDALFSEGSKILFRTALAVLKAQEDSLLAIDNAGEAALQGLISMGTETCHRFREA